MYNQNASQLAEVPATEMKSLLISMQDQNERFFQLISTIENSAGRLRSPNEAKESNMATPKPMSTGLIYDIGEQIDRYRQLNCRLEDVSNKLNALI